MEKKQESKKTKEELILLNENIPFPRVLLIGLDGKKMDIPIEKALEIAKKEGVDLYCVSPNNTPPVCKLVNYQKLVYNWKKSKKKKRENEEKEVYISFTIGHNDLQTKIQKVQQWLNKGDSVKFILKIPNNEKTQLLLGEKKCKEILDQLKNTDDRLELSKEVTLMGKTLRFVLHRSNKKKQKLKFL